MGTRKNITQIHSFLVKHPIGTFIGIIAFDGFCFDALQAAQIEWGTKAEYRALSAEDLNNLKDQYKIYCASCG